MCVAEIFRPESILKGPNNLAWPKIRTHKIIQLLLLLLYILHILVDDKR